MLQNVFVDMESLNIKQIMKQSKSFRCSILLMSRLIILKMLLFGALVSKCILSFSGYIHSHFLNSRWVCVILSILALITLRPNSKLPSFAAIRTVDFSTILTCWITRKTIFLSMEVGTFRGGNHNMNQNFVFKQELGRLCLPLKKKRNFFLRWGRTQTFGLLSLCFFTWWKHASILKSLFLKRER